MGNAVCADKEEVAAAGIGAGAVGVGADCIGLGCTVVAAWEVVTTEGIAATAGEMAVEQAPDKGVKMLFKGLLKWFRHRQNENQRDCEGISADSYMRKLNFKVKNECAADSMNNSCVQC